MALGEDSPAVRYFQDQLVLCMLVRLG